MKTAFWFHRPVRLSLGLALLFILATLVLLATPGGRVLAQQMYQFFTRQSDLPPIATPDPSLTPVVIDVSGAEPAITGNSNLAIQSGTTTSGTTVLTITNPTTETYALGLQAEEGSSLITGNEPITLTVHTEENGFSYSYSTNSGGGGGGGGGGSDTPIPTYTVAEIQSFVTFDILEFTTLPLGYQFSNALTPAVFPSEQRPPVGSPVWATISYQLEDYFLTLTQTYLEPGQVIGSTTVGDNVEIQTTVLQPGIIAEYVKGRWVYPDTPSLPGQPLTSYATWDNTLPDQQLTWQIGNIHYQLTSNDPTLTFVDLVTLAQNLQ